MDKFGWWFVSGRFDELWSLDQLANALRLARRPEPEYPIAKRLVELSPRWPLQAVQCLQALLAVDRRIWPVVLSDGKARAILVSALNSSDNPAREAARQLVDELGARGHSEFNDLAPPP
jgi:hypothetical protein